MDKLKEIKYSVSEVKNSIIDTSLVVGSLFSSLNYVVSSLNKLINTSIGFAFFLESFFLLSLIIVTFLRSKLSTELKAGIIILLIIFFSLVDAFLYGLLSAARIYLILVPFFSIIYLSPRKSLSIFFISFLLFILIGYFHHIGILTLHSNYLPEKYIFFFYPWVINGLHISTVALIIFFVTWKFFKSFSELIADLERRNKIIAEKELNYREIFNSSSEAIFIHDASSGNILDVNEIMLHLFGFENKEKVINSSVSVISANTEPYTDKEAFEFIKKTISEGPQLFEWKARKQNGEMIWIEVSLRSSEIGGQGRVLAVVRDITLRRKTEHALADSEKRFREMSEMLPQTVFETDSNGIITYINKIGLEIFHLTDEDIKTGISLFSFLNEEERQKAISNFNKTMEGLPVDSNFYNLILKNGEIAPIQIYSKIFETSDNQKGMRGIVLDITERIEAERAIRDSESKYRLLVESMNEILILIDSNDIIRFVNKKFTEIVGYSPEEIIGKNGFMLLADPDDRARIENASQNKDIQGINRYEVCFLSKSGKKLYFLVSSSAMEDINGITDGYILMLADISELKQTEKELIESRQQFMTLSQMAPVGIFRTRADGYTIYVNPKWTELSGISAEEALGDGWLRAVHPDDKDRLHNNWESDNQAGKKSLAEYRFLHQDGSIKWVLGNAIPEILDGEVKGFIGTITDITEKKLIEQELEGYRNHLEILVKERTDELEATNEELQMSNEELITQREALETTLGNLQKTQNQLIQSEKMASLGVLAAGVAHEINNPLNFIYGGILGLESFLSEYPPQSKDELETIMNGMHEGVRRAAAIVTSLSHYSRMENSVFTICDIHLIIDNCLVMLQNKLKNKVEIIKNYTSKPYKVNGNEGKLHQAFLNILSNAEQAIDQNGQIEITTETLKKNFQVIIKDSGHGIENEDLPKIFDPFFSTKDPGQGTGLGLSITYKIIQEHEGSIVFESDKVNGTKVIVKLPIVKSLYPMPG